MISRAKSALTKYIHERPTRKKAQKKSMFMLNELERDLGMAEDLEINIPTQILLNEISAKIKDTKKANIKKPVKKPKDKPIQKPKAKPIVKPKTRTMHDITDDIVEHYKLKKTSPHNITTLKKELINELNNDNKVILLKDIIRDTNYKEGNKYFDTFLKHNKNVHVNTLLPKYKQMKASEATTKYPDIPNYNILKILYDEFSLKNRKAVINTTNILAQIPHGQYISKIITSDNKNDLYPTPQECLKKFILPKHYNDRVILEPSAGMGSILFYILKKNKHKSLSAFELDRNMTNFIKVQFPTVRVESKDFLKTSTYNSRYNTIICNPPFTYTSMVNGKRKYDKSFFLMFYFKCLDYMYNTTNRTQKNNYIIFISGPNFFEEVWKQANKRRDDDDEHNINDYIDLSFENIRNMPDHRIKKLQQQSDVYKDFSSFEEYYEAIAPALITRLPGKCVFQTTGTKVYFYIMEFHN